MKFDRLIGERYKERPSDCAIESHAWMVRGGYMKYVAGGIYSSYNILRRIMRKIEEIIREEMDAVGGQEVLFPVVLPASLLKESGRYESIRSEMVRLNDRGGSPYVLGMTHEEAAVQLVREYGQTYVKYPFMVYQIQTKFRDEARPRGGMIRVREFKMKDAYSFHTSQADLDEYYMRCHQAYLNIFRRVGLPEVFSVVSDSGMMGGKVAHEFMLLTQAGEDSIVLCKNCGYKANMEAAKSVTEHGASMEPEPIREEHTPGMKTIADVCAFLGLPEERSCKAIVYETERGGEIVVLFLRGDLEANEVKLKNYLDDEIVPAMLGEESGLHAGYLGPYGLTGVRALYDTSLKGAASICCGANKPEYHYTGLNMERDMKGAEYHDFAKAKDGGICPECGVRSLTVSRGIELGNIFQLGTKYTETMNMQFADLNGGLRYPVMGCYGIGIERLAASVCEVRRDEHGPIWPVSIAPFDAHLLSLRSDDGASKEYADSLYEALTENKIDVLYDDRLVSAGVMFSDADLIGVPVRITVSPRNMREGCVEITSRDKSIQMKVKTDEAVQSVLDFIKKLANS